MSYKNYKHKPTGKEARVNFMNIDGKEEIRCYMNGNAIDYEILISGNDWEEINTMKYFKHIPTGKKVETAAEGYVVSGNATINSSYVPAWVVENSSDWQEIKKEYPYTILSFISDGRLYLLGKDDCYWSGSSGFGINDFLPPYKADIHSVRRESDGEIFTVEDCVFVDWNGDKNDTPIKHFVPTSSGLSVYGGYSMVFGLKNITRKGL